MSDDVDDRALAAFGGWLSSLAADAELVSGVVGDANYPPEVRTPLAGALNYLFKSLDLIDDGIEGLGFMDDAFILRFAARKAGAVGELPENLAGLAEDAGLVSEFLGELSPRLEAFVSSLEASTVRGRSVEAILIDAQVCEEMLGDVRAWGNRFEAPRFVMDENNLVKLRAFLGAKLPA
jgi:uncharacterized membrane protein YkvA (DUF1232 family)